MHEPRGFKYPNTEVLGPQYHTCSGFLEPDTMMIGPWDPLVTDPRQSQLLMQTSRETTDPRSRPDTLRPLPPTEPAGETNPSESSWRLLCSSVFGHDIFSY